MWSPTNKLPAELIDNGQEFRVVAFWNELPGTRPGTASFRSSALTAEKADRLAERWQHIPQVTGTEIEEYVEGFGWCCDTRQNEEVAS